ncbi:MAG: hypothetical protein D6732_22060, partial [Methanobacteriota archaeon]
MVQYTDKNLADSAWDGIKAAGQFIADTVISAVMDGLKGLMQTLFEGIFIALESFFGISWQSTQDGFILSLGSTTIEFGIKVASVVIEFSLNQQVVYTYSPFETLGSVGSDELLTILLIGMDLLLISLFVQFGMYSALVLTVMSLPLSFLGLISLLSLLIDNGGMTTEEKRHSFAVLTAGALMGLFVTEIVKTIKDPDGHIKDKVLSLARIGFGGFLTGLLAVPRVPPELFVWFLL